jgi:hypothetical protein
MRELPYIGFKKLIGEREWLVILEIGSETGE